MFFRLECYKWSNIQAKKQSVSYVTTSFNIFKFTLRWTIKTTVFLHLIFEYFLNKLFISILLFELFSTRHSVHIFRTRFDRDKKKGEATWFENRPILVYTTDIRVSTTIGCARYMVHGLKDHGPFAMDNDII